MEDLKVVFKNSATAGAAPVIPVINRVRLIHPDRVVPRSRYDVRLVPGVHTLQHGLVLTGHCGTYHISAFFPNAASDWKLPCNKTLCLQSPGPV